MADRMKLFHHMAAATLGTMLVLVALVAGLSYWRVEQGFFHYVRALEEARLEVPLRRLADVFQREHSWQRLVDEPRTFRRLLRREDDRDPPPDRKPDEDAVRRDRRERKHPDPLELPPRVSLYDAAGHRLIGRGSPDTDASRLPIQVHGQVVGWLGVRAIDKFNDLLDVHYMQHVRRDVVLVAITALLLGVLAAVLLARHLVRPIWALRDATQRLALGDFEARADLQRRDELGDLARDFATMAETLALHERARAQWVADTSHELRTPVTILCGEVACMLDGIRPLDREALLSLDAELRRLSTLVEDLSHLARANPSELRLQPSPVAVADLVSQAAAAFSGAFHTAGLRLEIDLTALAHTRVSGEPDRLRQVFANLFENALRYTDAGGVVRVSGDVSNGTVAVQVCDSAPGVEPVHLPRLFDRWYRVETSRSREHGGAGLGLAIARQWVEAHGGTITARASDLGGLCVEICLPRIDDAQGRT